MGLRLSLDRNFKEAEAEVEAEVVAETEAEAKAETVTETEAEVRAFMRLHDKKVPWRCPHIYPIVPKSYLISRFSFRPANEKRHHKIYFPP